MEPCFIRPEAVQRDPGILIDLAGGTVYIHNTKEHLGYEHGEKLCWVGVIENLAADFLGHVVGIVGYF